MSDKKKLIIPKGAGQIQQLGSGLRAKQTDTTTHFKKNCRYDYQPEICKDFYETGYCGYGENCKFIHDRSLTKSSLTLEREFEENRKHEAQKKTEELMKEQKEADEIKLQKEKEQKKETICPKCQKKYNEEKTPMIMKCGDWICSDCAIGCKKCPVCNTSTGGVFKAAKRKR
ncbi:RING finger protein 113A, putative [Entamoeba dispar SAW760]|uniref:RING finger protein 113A, putative n=1 Tax=Entamoeba dispar (strain ATCC PRA-260 / SAW760) TaxID=370354 RepID=B0EGG1_ENTDS|nr:RING finger protein 113A, putative [Entamoeba dispar SAW760]EDR26395.1 RING finger protein 113A, putative [Entamoeba dispar SAW760]|eukprot:EDR26395.1 RING finger protein 113A, putative [Entamoeba dispar SAW760]